MGGIDFRTHAPNFTQTLGSGYAGLGSDGIPATFSKGGVTLDLTMGLNPFDTKRQARYFVGPGIFILGATNFSVFPQSGVVFCYDRVPSQGIDTVVATNDPSALVTNLVNIQIPVGKRMRLLDGLYPIYLRVTSTNGASARLRVGDSDPSGYGVLPEAFEISGPSTVSITPNNQTASYYLTYYFVSSVVQAASQSVLSPAGSFVIVEKSADLTSWYPAFFTTDQNDPQAYFRLNVTR